MGPKKRPTTKSATPGGVKRSKSTHCARPQDSKKQMKRHTLAIGGKKQSLTSTSSTATLCPRIDEVNLRLAKLIEKAKEHMELGRKLSEEWVLCEAEVEDIEHLTTMVDDQRLLSLRRQLDDVNTIMSGDFFASDSDSSDA